MEKTKVDAVSRTLENINECPFACLSQGDRLELNGKISMTKYIVVMLGLLSLTVLAQTNSVPVPNVPGVTGNSSLLLGLIPLFVPILVELAKRGISVLPSWSLPIIAAALGQLINYVSGILGGPSTTALNGVILGAAGTGLREILDQLNQKRKGEV